MERRSLLATSVGVLALAAACAQNPESPVSPSAATGSAAANADGSTLKVSAPDPVSPGEGERTETVRPTIVFRNSAGRFTSVALSYRVQVFDGSGNVIAELGVAQDASGQTSLTADTDLAYDTEYRWRVRAVTRPCSTARRMLPASMSIVVTTKSSRPSPSRSV